MLKLLFSFFLLSWMGTVEKYLESFLCGYFEEIDTRLKTIFFAACGEDMFPFYPC